MGLYILFYSNNYLNVTLLHHWVKLFGVSAHNEALFSNWEEGKSHRGTWFMNAKLTVELQSEKKKLTMQVRTGPRQQWLTEVAFIWLITQGLVEFTSTTEVIFMEDWIRIAVGSYVIWSLHYLEWPCKLPQSSNFKLSLVTLKLKWSFFFSHISQKICPGGLWYIPLVVEQG